MMTLKELAQYNISEGILSGYDDSLRQYKGYLDTLQFQNWSEKSFTKASWKEGRDGYVLTGEYRLENLDTYTGPKIKKVTGSLTICKSRLTSLKQVFADDALIDGTFTLEDNDNLTDLVGAPVQVKTLIVSGCKKLKSLEGCPVVLMNLYLSRNGKKFDKETIASKYTVNKNIFCSELSETEPLNENMICEAFKSIHLSKLWDRIKDLKYKGDWLGSSYKSDVTMKNILGDYYQWDKIESSAVHEYEVNERGIKIARKFITNGSRGWVMLYNKAGNITALIKGHNVYMLGDRDTIFSHIQTSIDTKVGDIIEKWVKRADVIVIIDLSNAPTAWEMKRDRKEAQKGAIAMNRGEERLTSDITPTDIRYYQDLANENRRRYKAAILKIRAQKAAETNNYEKIKERVDKCLARHTALINKVISTPEKYTSFRIQDVNTYINNLLTMLTEYAKIYIAAGKGDKYESNYIYNYHTVEKALEAFQHDFDEKCRVVETKLTNLESI